MIKQVIVIRKDLNMRKGKMCAQVAHASMKVFFDRIDSLTISNKNKYTLKISNLTEHMTNWIGGSFTKIVVSCNSEDEILKIEKDCISNSIPHAVITDNGATEFNCVPTITCIAVGPDDADKIDLITRDYKLI